MLKTFDGVSYKRVAGQVGDRSPSFGFERKRVIYTATGGETSINLSTLTGGFSYTPGHAQIEVKRSSGGTLITGVDYFESSPSVITFLSDDPLLSGEIVEITKQVSVAGIMALAPRIEAFTASATQGQTLVAADFSWDLNLNPAKGVGAVQVLINGIAQTRGEDYLEIDLGLARTNQIELLSPLTGQENIQILPIYQAIDDSAAVTSFNTQTTIRTQEAMKALGRAFIDESELMPVAGTQIVNRAKIVDPTKNLSAQFGINRIPTKSLFEIQKEAGPSGMLVYGIEGDLQDLIRLVGRWSAVNSADGSFISGTQDSYLEVTFLGTGLNLLTSVDSAQSGADYRVSVNGGSEGDNVCPGLSAVLDTRNASSNVVVRAVSGLPHGVHTVKIRCASSTADLRVFGVELVNDVEEIRVSEGSAIIAGSRVKASSQQISYRDSVTGTKGGRSIIFVDKNGVVGSAFTPVGTTRNYTSVSHTEEEMVRSVYWREFGANRSDDFSKLSGTSTGTFSFTLSDGSTTLTAVNPVAGANGVYAALNQFITVTFIGTGLDILLGTSAGATTVPLTISIDGTTVASSVTGLSGGSVVSICSGLPYGSHTVKLAYGASGTVFPAIQRFNIYAPKKPAVPDESVEIADYFVLADVAPKTSAGIDSAATGAISKMATREITYVGTWNSAISSSYRGGWYVQSNAQGSYLEYTFFGTGFDFRTVRATDQSSNITVQLTDSTGALAALGPAHSVAGSATVGTYGNLSYGGISNTEGSLSSASGNVLNCNGTTTLGAGFFVKDLPLGLYTVRLTQSAPTTVTTYLTTSGIEIFTPVHVPKSGPMNIQNELSLGSCSLLDTRTLKPFEEAKERNKVWAQAIGQGTASSSATTFVPTPGLATTLYTPRCALSISASICAYHSQTVQGARYAIFVDGTQVSETFVFDVWAASSGTNTGSISAIVPVSEGFHRVEVMHCTSSGSLTLTTRMLSVQEL